MRQFGIAGGSGSARSRSPRWASRRWRDARATTPSSPRRRRPRSRRARRPRRPLRRRRSRTRNCSRSCRPRRPTPTCAGRSRRRSSSLSSLAPVFQTGDLDVLAALSSPECMFCADGTRRCLVVNSAVGDHRDRGATWPRTFGRARELSRKPTDSPTSTSPTSQVVRDAAPLGRVPPRPPQAGGEGRIYFRMTLVGAVWQGRGCGGRRLRT